MTHFPLPLLPPLLLQTSYIQILLLCFRTGLRELIRRLSKRENLLFLHGVWERVPLRGEAADPPGGTSLQGGAPSKGGGAAGEVESVDPVLLSQDDVGGRRILQKKWTSFAKASLLCRPPNRPPHNVLRDMFTLQPPEGSDSSETLFYGVFTSQW